MRKFYQDVDKRSRKAMTDFLAGHFRYSTMNSWNGSSSYAHNMKFHNLMLDGETLNKLYEISQCEEFYEHINELLRGFGEKYGWQWQAGFNGRNNGYLVLYQGERKSSTKTHTVISTSGRGTDDWEDFSDWEMSQLRERVELVQSFGKLADAIVAEVVFLADNYEVEQEDYSVTKTHHILVEKAATA